MNWSILLAFPAHMCVNEMPLRSTKMRMHPSIIYNLKCDDQHLSMIRYSRSIISSCDWAYFDECCPRMNAKKRVINNIIYFIIQRWEKNESQIRSIFIPMRTTQIVVMRNRIICEWWSVRSCMHACSARNVRSIAIIEWPFFFHTSPSIDITEYKFFHSQSFSLTSLSI